MQVRWSEPAADDLGEIRRYIERDNPDAAQRVAMTIYDGCGSLAEMPHRGRKGNRPGTREMVFHGVPYIVVYRVRNDAVVILRILHGAQDR
jgi:toxin ParE1/3/4